MTKLLFLICFLFCDICNLFSSNIENSYTTPPNLFKQQKPFILIEIQFCARNNCNIKNNNTAIMAIILYCLL